MAVSQRLRRLEMKSSRQSFAFTPENEALGGRGDRQISAGPAGLGGDPAAVAGAGAGRRLAAADGDRGRGARSSACRTIRVLEVATFYTMFNLEPVGKLLHPVLRHDALRAARRRRHQEACCERRIGEQQHVTAGRQLLLARGRVPRRLLQRADGADQRRLLRGPDAENFEKLLDDLAAGRPVKAGSQIGRRSSEPDGTSRR